MHVRRRTVSWIAALCHRPKGQQPACRNSSSASAETRNAHAVAAWVCIRILHLWRATDFMRIPFAQAMLVPLPAELDPVAAIGVADMALDSWRAVGPSVQERHGARVLVAGGNASVIGLYAAGIAVALGAAEVVYWDGDEQWRALAATMGRPQMEHVLRLCHAGRFNPNDVPTSVFGFEQAAEAWLSKDVRTAASRLSAAHARP